MSDLTFNRKIDVDLDQTSWKIVLQAKNQYDRLDYPVAGRIITPDRAFIMDIKATSPFMISNMITKEIESPLILIGFEIIFPNLKQELMP